MQHYNRIHKILVLLRLKLLQKHEMMKLSVDRKRNTYIFIGSEIQNFEEFCSIKRTDGCKFNGREGEENVRLAQRELEQEFGLRAAIINWGKCTDSQFRNYNLNHSRII